MLLISLELENIRSYRSARISFPKGRMLLSGDIGSGKSTILLAIEFALFGLIRGWNDGEKLMRHDSSNACVRLELDLNGMITIERSLKRVSTGIQQEEVRITEDDGVERRITPSEARSLIIARLGYPSEFSTKQPVLFRYTIFTPQESMKQIIEERPEARLAAIRTIFGIDRYESISRNAQIVARSLKQTSAALSGRLERKSTVIDELSELKRTIAMLTHEHKNAHETLSTCAALLKTRTAALEKARSALETERSKLAERERLVAERSELEKEIEKLVAERASLVIEPSVEIPDTSLIERRIEAAESSIRSLDERIESEREKTSRRSMRKAALTEKRTGVLESLEAISVSEKEREECMSALRSAIERFSCFDPDAVRSELERAQSSMQEIREERTRIDERIRSIKERIETMPADECPTCGQKVDESHRESAISESRSLVASLSKQKEPLASRLENLEKKHSELSDRLARFAALEDEKRSLPPERSEEREELTTSLERIDSELADLSSSSPDDPLESLREERAGKVSERDALSKKLKRAQEAKLREERTKRAVERKSAIEERLTTIRQRIARIVETMPHADPKVSEHLERARKEHAQAQSEHLNAERSSERITERLRASRERSEKLTAELESLRRLESERASIESVTGFLSDQIPDLASRVESAIMRRILIETNDHFSKWFSLLVDDLDAYLDERFTPRIVQSGYDVSFENLSGGERTSVALAFRLALHEAINHLTGQSATGLLILDEPTDGFSSEQLSAVRSVLAQLRSEQVIIVSHEAVVESFVDHTIRIEKQGNESMIR